MLKIDPDTSDIGPKECDERTKPKVRKINLCRKKPATSPSKTNQAPRRFCNPKIGQARHREGGAHTRRRTTSKCASDGPVVTSGTAFAFQPPNGSGPVVQRERDLEGDRDATAASQLPRLVPLPLKIVEAQRHNKRQKARTQPSPMDEHEHQSKREKPTTHTHQKKIGLNDDLARLDPSSEGARVPWGKRCLSVPEMEGEDP
ncbi:hypothetical protein N658DRAFT_232789 [Parathielavia hyrcaniae]|uniref:Uncharacterized protein n=1 Tax=Parathielavia hyrcaniae TaxID=113614 RepID=A0AAN6Q5B0_9PEZI|nr:hypothetical protein N658DRAFT_232789 [Parathielavia hyrcaniae]